MTLVINRAACCPNIQGVGTAVDARSERTDTHIAKEGDAATSFAAGAGQVVELLLAKYPSDFDMSKLWFMLGYFPL